MKSEETATAPELPNQQSELPTLQPERLTQQSELPNQQSEFPNQQSEFPARQPGLPAQQPGLPAQQPGLLAQQPGRSTQQLQYPETEQPKDPESMDEQPACPECIFLRRKITELEQIVDFPVDSKTPWRSGEIRSYVFALKDTATAKDLTRQSRREAADRLDTMKTAVLNSFRRNKIPPGIRDAVRQGFIEVHDRVRAALMWYEDREAQAALEREAMRVKNWAAQ